MKQPALPSAHNPGKTKTGMRLGDLRMKKADSSGGGGRRGRRQGQGQALALQTIPRWKKEWGCLRSLAKELAMAMEDGRVLFYEMNRKEGRSKFYGRTELGTTVNPHAVPRFSYCHNVALTVALEVLHLFALSICLCPMVYLHFL
jgi:hypothetical protein